MIGAYLGTLLLVVCALLIGQALATLAHGARRGSPLPVSWLAPAYGLGALLVLSAIFVRLPGRAVTVAVVVLLTTVGSAVYLRGRTDQRRTRAKPALIAAAIAVLLASLPFMIAGNVGVLGVGLVNDDMASHLVIADHIADPSTGQTPSFIKGGYPIGPHALAAALDMIPGAGMVEAFAALTLSLVAFHAMLGAGVLRGMPLFRRVVGACLIALPYLGAAYLVQGAFKEPLQALLLIGFALSMGPLIGLRSPLSVGAPDASSQTGLDDHAAGGGEGRASGKKPTVFSRFLPLGAAGPDHAEAVLAAEQPLLRILPLAVLAAASVLNYSTPGLIWICIVAGALAVVRIFVVKPRPRIPEIEWRRLLPYALGVVVIVALATVQEWGRIADFSRLSALNPERFGSDLGNLSQSLSPLEALGIWPSSEFDATPTSTSVPAIAFYLGAAIGLASLVCGLWRDRRQHLETMPTLLAAMAVVWVLSALFASPYNAAKALAVAAPVVMAVAVRGTFGDRGPRLALGCVFVVLAASSSFLVLRSAPVGPDDADSHGAQLESFRELVKGEEVLFLGRDDFIRWYLRGSGPITGIVTNFYDVEDARPRFKKGEGGGEKFDVDAVFPRTLDRFQFVLESAGGPSSLVPPRFVEAARTRDYVLYERTGATGKRRTLDEGREPGAIKGCVTLEEKELQHSQGTATIWDPPPVIERPEEWHPDDAPSDGDPSTIEIEIPEPGRWLISLAYDSRRPLRVVSEELGIDETLAANLDFRGATPTFPVAEVKVEARTRATVVAEPVPPNFVGRLLRAPNEAHLRELTATPRGATKRIPIRQACDEYVDWYRTRKVNEERIPSGNRD